MTEHPPDHVHNAAVRVATLCKHDFGSRLSTDYLTGVRNPAEGSGAHVTDA